MEITASGIKTLWVIHVAYDSINVDLNLLMTDPVANVSIHGNNWLKHGDIMNMNITCNGSAPFYYCWAFDGFMNETSTVTQKKKSKKYLFMSF